VLSRMLVHVIEAAGPVDRAFDRTEVKLSVEQVHHSPVAVPHLDVEDSGGPEAAEVVGWPPEVG